jgi:hypothetical protein
MEIQLTEEEKKTLKLFVYYIKSYGKRRVYTEYVVYEYQLDYRAEEWYGQGAPIGSYKEIDELVDSIVKRYDLVSEIGGDNGNGRIEFIVDVEDMEIEVEVASYSLATNDKGDTYDINEKFGESGVELLEFMKSKNISEGRVDFYGGGDSGEISEFIEFGNHGEPSKRLDRLIMDTLYEWLEDFYGGWEINEGSQGYFTFFIDGECELFFQENYEAEERDTVLMAKI